ncbi:MAG TPA: hypothetical protein VGC76_18620 [Pyrinomonadaceae bacterium]
MKKVILAGSFLLSLIFAAAISANAQKPPTEAQIKKDVMNPGVIAIIFRGGGSFEKYATNGAIVNEFYRSITVRRKTDRPGVTLDVLGDVVYRLIGGRWVYRTMRLSGNQYGGIKNPSVTEINQALQSARLDNFGDNNVIGEYESLRLAPAPEWEWFTPNSVAFYAIAVYRAVNRGRQYQDEPFYRAPAGFDTIDYVQRVLRFRIYRKDENSPWNNATTLVVAALEIPDGKGGKIQRLKLLDRKDYREEEVKNMPRLSKVPLLGQ